MRGEYIFSLNFFVYSFGSPPHAWGIRLQNSLGYFTFWFTPTCVGNTPLINAGFQANAVHPHMRGEYL